MGNPLFLAEARAALADIRKTWRADAPVPVAEDADTDRVAGRPREEVIREHIAKMQAALKPREN